MTLAEVSLNGIEFTIKGSTDSASDSIKKLTKDLNELKEAMKSSQGVNGLASALKKLENVNSTMLIVAKNVLEDISKLDFSNIQQAASGIKDIAAAAREISNIGKGGDKKPDILPNVDNGGKTPYYPNLFDYAILGAKQFWHWLGRVKNGVFMVASEMGKLAAVGAKGAFSALLAPMKKFASSVSGVASSLKGVVGGFKRIMGYRIIRSIIKEITQGFSEGIKNLYGWSSLFTGAMYQVGGVGKSFKEVMDGIATSTLYLKNSVAAAAAPFISALAPAIDYVIDKAVALLNVINQLMALFSGATSWNKAIKKTQEYGDAVGGAGGAAKEALKYLAPFDELNRLPDDKNGGGGGGSGTDYSGMFEESTEFLEGLKDFADSLKEKINAGDWQGVGVLIGEKINGIIDFLEDGNYFATTGARIGTAINAWFTTKYWTLETINFGHIGGDIATAFNNMVENIDFDIIGRSITQKFTILGDLIVSAVNTINWREVGNSIGDLIRGAFDQLSNWLDGIDWQTFGYNLWQDLKDVVEGLNFTAIAESLMRLLGTAFGAATAIVGNFVNQVWEDIKGYFEQYLPDGWDSTGGEIIAGIFKGITDALLNVGTWIAEHVFQPLFNGIKSAFGIASPASTMIEPGRMIGEGILEGLLQPFKNIAAWIDEHIVQPIKDALKNFKISDLIFGGDDSGNSSGNDGWLSGIFGGSLDIEAVVTSVKDNVPTAKKVIDKVKGIFGSTDKGASLTASDKQIPAQAKFTSFIKNFTSGMLTSGGSPIIGAQAKFASFIKAFTGSTATSSGSPIFGSVAKFVGRQLNFTGDKTSSGNPIFKSLANFYGRQLNFSGDTTSSGNPIFKSIANFSGRQLNFSGDTTSAGNPIFRSIANFTGRQYDNLNTIFGSTANFISWLTGWGGNPSLDSYAEFIDQWWKYGTPSMPVYADLQYTGGTHSGYGTYTYAKGGAYYGGVWHDIPQAANGGSFHGTLFYAGENGAEVVGHAGGRTEVLNRSQLAATMYAAVRSAMSEIAFNVSAPSMATGTADDGANEDTLYRAFLRALNDSDVADRPIELDGNTLYSSMVNRNRQNTRLTGVNALA